MTIETLAGVLAIPLSVFVAGRVGLELIRDTVAESDSGVSREIEALLPLKGRWLRLLMLAPAHLFLSLVVFAGACPVLMLLITITLSLLQGLCRLVGAA
jgi:hypothetical protein